MAFTPIAAIFFLIPFELYYNARQYWNFNRHIPISFALTGLAIYLGLAAIIFVTLKTGRQLGSYVSIFLFYLGTFILLADVFSPLQASPLNGTKITSNEPLSNTLIEAFILILVVVSLIILRPHRLPSFAVPFTLFLILLSAIYLCLIVISSEPNGSSAKIQRKNPKLKGNVYHIVLDEMQTDAALLFLEGEGAKKNFPGFTLYCFNMSNYLYTKSSFPSYMTGSLYTQASFRRWLNRYKREGLLKELYRKGYRITMYAARAKWRNPFVARFKTLQKIYREETQAKNVFYNDFTQIWLARIMPNILTNEALSIGKKLGQFVYKRLKSKVSENTFSPIKGLNRSMLPVTIAEGIEPFSSVLMLNRLIETEKKRSPNGEYIYAHAIIPHGPYVFNQDFEFDPELRSKGASGYYSQAKCALKLVIDFLEELKRLGRYDSSTIVIHADTGHGLRGYIKKKGHHIIGTAENKSSSGERFLGNPFLWNKSQVLSRTMALLMIKPAHSFGNLKYSDKLSQLIDVYPTLADLLNLKSKGKTRGISLFRPEPSKQRKNIFFLYNPQNEEPKMIRITISNPRRPWNSRLIVRGYKAKHSPAGIYDGVIFKKDKEN